MTVEEAKTLATEKLVEVNKVQDGLKKAQAEIVLLEDKIKVLKAEQQTLRAEGSGTYQEYKILKHMADGNCQAHISYCNFSKSYSLFGNDFCSKKAKPGETLCGIHLRSKNIRESWKL